MKYYHAVVYRQLGNSNFREYFVKCPITMDDFMKQSVCVYKSVVILYRLFHENIHFRGCFRTPGFETF